MWIFFSCVKDSNSSRHSSRPSPDCFTPPNGALAFVTEREAAEREAWPAFLAEPAAARRATRATLERPNAAPDQPRSEGDGAIWIAAERLPQFESVYPRLQYSPPIEAPDEFATKDWSREEALTEIVRGRLEGLGPVTSEAVAGSMALPVADVEASLARLAAEGFVMRGTFTPDAQHAEWCDRARIGSVEVRPVRELSVK
jgi:ATP-dependent Lhr-like helicase